MMTMTPGPDEAGSPDPRPAASSGPGTPAAAPADGPHGPGLADLLPPGAVPEPLAAGATWLEGPCWVPALGGLLVSDIPADRILLWTPETGLNPYATGVEFANGRAVDAAGTVVQCSHGRRRVEILHPDGSTTSLADRWGAARLNSPNDVVVGPDGAVWFTDPPYGIVQPHEGHPGEREYGDHFVFRCDPTTGQVRPVVTDVEEPNGLAFSPDGTLLYVTDTSAALGAGTNRLIRVYDVVEGRACKNGRVFARMEAGLADGIRVDERGNVWSSHGPNVRVFDPAGAVLLDIPFPATVGNLCFGGPWGLDLFVAASTTVHRLATRVRGAQVAAVLGGGPGAGTGARTSGAGASAAVGGEQEEGR